MRHRQREHIATVMQVADGVTTSSAQHHDEVIRKSWLRCVNEYRLDPTRMQEAVILPGERIREHQDQMEDFLHIARHGLETLYQQVAGMGYVVLLTDARGVTVDFLGDLQLDQSLRRAGLYLGADWSEHHAGTCGVGTCISTGQALTVHQGDHFDATHIPLTCTTAPVYGSHGQLSAVLDISALSSPQPKQSQHLALQLVKMYAHQIENAHFLYRYRHDWILRLSIAPQFLDVNPEYLLAMDAGGQVIGHNRRAELLFEGDAVGRLIGRRFDQLFNASIGDLGRFISAQAADRRAITTAANNRLLFLLASPPPARWMHSGMVDSGRVAPAIPAPLAALSGGDPQLDRQMERVSRLVNSPVSLLVTGETGTGKEYFAKAIHQSSERRSGPFIAVNCAAIPETLIESELFGYMPGSFSGAAAKGKRGLIAEADGGTLFLDEIGDMPRLLQARLLRVLAEKEVLPIGAARPIAVNIRVVAATHCDLKNLVHEGHFRDDLYYRLNGAQFNLPPLRQRRDLPYMMQRMLHQHGQRTATEIAPETMELLLAHDWPGNLRELHNVIQYASVVCSHGVIYPDDLPEEFLQKSAASSPHPSSPTLKQPHVLPHVDAERLIKALRSCHWNISAAAQTLGIARMTLYRRMKKFGIATPNHLDDC